MHKSMNLLALKNRFQREFLNLRHIFYSIVLIARLDCEIWLNFSC